jgi:hypothetical protein
MRASTLAVAVAVLASALPLSGAAPAERQLSPCSLLTRGEVERLTAWHVDSVHPRRYSFNGASGAMCVFDSSQGTVVVIVPDRGMPFPGDSPFTDPGSSALVRHDPATGIEVMYYNGTASMTVRKRDVAVRVVPASHIASYFEVEPFAERVIAHPRAQK